MDNSTSNEINIESAVILVGGLGTRLRSVVSDRPKVLVPIHNKAFLSYLLDQLLYNQFRDVTLCCGYMGKSIQDAYGGSYLGLRLKYSWEESPLGTGGALRNAMDQIAASDVMVMNGDSFIQTDLQSFYRWHKSLSADISLLLAEVPDTSRYGRVSTQDYRIIEFEEKKSPAGAGRINAGIYLAKKEILLEIPTSMPISLERDMLPIWAKQGRVFGHVCRGRFIDVGTPESYLDAEKFFSGNWLA